MSAVVIDTNVLASGAVGFQRPGSTPGQLLRRWRDGAFPLVVSEHILTELARTLAAPYFHRQLSEDQAARLLALLRQEATVTAITATVQGVATHPEDDLVLATAVSARAQHLVTGDGKLQRLGSYQGVTILSPRAFVDLLTSRPPS